MSLNLFRGMARTMEEFREDNGKIVMSAIYASPFLLAYCIYMGATDWWVDRKYDTVAQAEINTVHIPDKFWKFHLNDPNADRPMPDKPDSQYDDLVNGFYETSYMDLNRDGHITKLERNAYEDNEHGDREKQESRIAQLLADNPKFVGIIDQMHFETALDVIEYSKMHPKRYQYLVNENKSNPENLKRILIHGVTKYEIRNSTKSTDSKSKSVLDWNWGTSKLNLFKDIDL